MHTQSDCTLPDYNSKNSTMKRVRYDGTKRAKSLEETVVIDKLTHSGDKFLIYDSGGKNSILLFASPLG